MSQLLCFLPSDGRMAFMTLRCCTDFFQSIAQSRNFVYIQAGEQFTIEPESYLLRVVHELPAFRRQCDHQNTPVFRALAALDQPFVLKRTDDIGNGLRPDAVSARELRRRLGAVVAQPQEHQKLVDRQIELLQSDLKAVAYGEFRALEHETRCQFFN